MIDQHDSLETLLNGLRAAAEPSRLRLLVLCSQGEWTVTELTQVLGQSQPRVSRHLKLLTEASLLERFREGSWVFYRRARRGPGARLARNLCRMLPPEDADLALDRQRLAAVRSARQEQAAQYFAAQATRWDQVRSLHLDEAQVESALLEVFGDQPPRSLLDIGTGTGRVLQLLAPRIGFGLGVDLSREMLAVARANLDRTSLRNCQVRQGDMYHLPLPDGSFDAATLHNVLRFADDPGAALTEAARVLRPGGRLVVVDFAPHSLEFLREQHAHRRLGFADAQMRDWFAAAGLAFEPPRRLAGDPLTVVIWPARRIGTAGDFEQPDQQPSAGRVA
ncbi:MAG TPA: metalloregulator ArsR/SmtB family transcription factor [Geminicoccaceae bacterium]|nr:metalloregulator ArsR/SmtB family transcription factor [Geminicoccaceae bacterium]